jgi:hypothetical protein
MPTVCRDQDDGADWLDRAVLESKGAGASLLKQFACGKDSAGNRAGEGIGRPRLRRWR